MSKGRADDIIGKKVGISASQYHKSKKIVEAAKRDDDIGNVS